MSEIGDWIAVVDDNPENRRIVVRHLQLAGFETKEGRTGREALELAQQLPRVMILEVQLPDGLGFDFCRQIKADPATSQVAIIHTSATLVTGDAQVKGLEAGANAYLIAPFDFPVLVSTVKAALRVHDAEAKARAAHASLSRQLADMRQLHETTLKVAGEPEIGRALHEALSASIGACGADYGIIALKSKARDDLELAASFGFNAEFIERMRFIPIGIGASGVAYQGRKHVVIENARVDPRVREFQSLIDLGGFSASHSVPLIARSSDVVGVLTVHFKQLHRADEQATRLLDLYARMAADTVERHNTFLERESQSREMEKLSTVVADQAQLFDVTLSNLTDLAYAVGPDFRFLFANQPLLQLLSLPLDEVVGKNCYDLGFPNDVADRMQTQMQHLFATGEPIHDEAVFKLGSGEEEYHEYRWNAVRDAHGIVVAMAGSSRINTERRRLEQQAHLLLQLQENIIRLEDPNEIIHEVSRTIGEYLGAHRCFFYSWRADTRHVSVTDDWHVDGLEDFAGEIDLGEFGSAGWIKELNRGPLAVNDIEADEQWRPFLERYREFAIRSYASSRFVRQDSGVVSLAATSIGPRQWKPDELSFLENTVARVWPLVERARATRALQDGERRYRELVQGLPVAVYTCGADGRIELFNDAAIALWGRRPEIDADEKWCGSQRLLSKNGSDVALADAPMAHAIRENRALREEMILEQPTGELRYVIMNPQPIRDSGGKLVGAVNVVIDITDRKREEQRAVFLHELSQQLSLLTDANEIMRTAATKLGQGLRAHRCFFIECQEGESSVLIAENWLRDPLVKSVAGTYSISEFGSDEWWRYFTAGNFRVTDVLTHPLTHDTGHKAVEAGVRSYAVQPFRHKDRWVALLIVTDDRPRSWTDEEMTMVEDVMARVWPMVQRARATAALRHSENDLRFALEAAQLGSWEWDLTTGVLRSSDRCKANFGLPPEADFEDGDYTKNIFPDDVARMHDAIEQAIMEHGIYETEYRVVWPDGKIHWILERGQSVYNDENRTKKIVGVNLDITERKAADQSMRENAERLELASDAAKLGIWSWDAVSDQMKISPRMAEILEIDANSPAMARSVFLDSLHEGDRERARLAIKRAIENRSVYDEEYRLKRKDGTTWWITSKGRGTYDHEGTPVGMLGVVQDITERRNVENYLRQQRDILEQVLRGDSLPEVLNQLTHQVESSADRKLVVSVMLLEPEGQTLRPAAGASVPVTWNHYFDFVVPGANVASGGAAAFFGRPVVTADIANSPDWENYKFEASKHGFKACWSTPIIASDGVVLGTFDVYYFEVTEPTAREREVVEIVVRTASIAIERRRNEAAVRKSEERLRLATAKGGVGVWDWDIAINRVTWSDSMYRIYGITPDEFDGTGEGVLRFVHPDDREMLVQVNERAIASDEVFEVEFRGLRADGQVLWLLSNATVIREQGVAVRLSGAILDITERKQAEEALRKKEAQLSLVAGTAPILLAQCDTEKRFTFVNRAYLEKRGLTLEAVIGRRVDEVLDEKSYRVLKPYIDRVLRGEKVTFEAELPYRAEMRSVEGTYVPEIDADGRVKGWVSAMVDITDRKRVHDAVRQLAAIVESSDDAIISRKLDGEIMSWNKGAEKLFGYTATEALGKPVLMLIPRERINEETTIVGKIRQGSSVEHYETVRVRKDGSRVDVSLSVSPIRNEFGGVIGASKIARDITQQKRYAEELEAAQRQLRSHAQSLEQKVEERTALLREAVAQMEEFSYTVSHDLRAPLRAMNSYSQALLEDYAPQLDGTAREYLNRIQRSCQRMERLTHDVLMYSRLVRSEVVLDPIDLDEMMLDIIDQYEDLQEPRAEVELASPLGQAVGHEVSLGQCLTNLLTNAVKFVGPGVKPKIRVWTEQRGARVRIWIEDNGIGIAPEHQAKIFLIFERLHGREEYEGTGMGLAIVRKTMEKMGGSCGVESKGSDGSRFWLELPLADAAHEDATTTHPAGRG